MYKNGYAIRTMTREEMEVAVEWAAKEGWNPGLNDAASFSAADPEGFLVGLLDGEPIASISVVKYGASFGFLGFYIVKPEHRGRGYGWAIWQAGLDRLAGRTVGLDGVVEQQDNYRKSGFEWAHNNTRFRGVRKEAPAPDSNIVPLASLPFDAVRDYDRALFPDDRTAFLESWINQPRHVALGLLRDRALTGYGVLRACRNGYKVGPLFADHAEAADRLYRALTMEAPRDAEVFLDVPSVNPAAMELAQRHEMTPVFETARMYKGPRPKLSLERLFGITTFELG